MYKFKSRVRYSETDETGCISLDAIINYLQDCTNFKINPDKDQKIAIVLKIPIKIGGNILSAVVNDEKSPVTFQ